MSTDNSTQFSRTPALIALGLALLLVLGVLFGARYVSDQAGRTPVQISELPGTDSDNPTCAAVLEELPEEVAGLQRAELAEPVPAGTAAWISGQQDELTLRCGVNLPFQYTALSEIQEIAGTEWLQVVDPTAGDSLETWYTVNRSPNIALTLYRVSEDALAMDTAAPAADLAAALATVAEEKVQPFPTPLADMAEVADPGERCAELMNNLPESFGSDLTYTRADIEGTGLNPETAAAWISTGLEPVVLHCGVEPPANYRAGETLNQVNEIPWFEDTTLANGTTSSTWFALGRDIDIAVNVPQASGNSAVVTLGEAIAAHTAEQ
ncbi:hypothetical protein COCCU_06330 [Corynebacterium occultum]|uniref:DUF3515 domain-containing protein n=1 Tax=Corynebacterium occultum TaxID=2675219 RepID=A0A6B8W7D0_9CORY|nr:DUF3515 domain-containing protein [Corynebacterium occultum]QGU07205.1 hypothetical protein COCCU_06330 [Corynebacterium occultum]